MKITVTTDTGSTLVTDVRLYQKFVNEQWRNFGDRRKAAQQLAQVFGLRYRSAQKVVKAVLDQKR